METAEHLLKITLDGGETEDVLDVLQNIHFEESSFLRDLLLARYPLSREVLMAALDAAASFDPWHLTQVLVANSRLPHDVYQFLNDNAVLNQFFMQFVHDAQTSNGANLGRLLQMEVSARSHQKATKFRDIIRYFYHDGDSLDVTEWQNFVQSHNDNSHKWLQFSDHIAAQNYSAALALLDSVNLPQPGVRQWYEFYVQTATADSVSQGDIDFAWQYLNDDSLMIGAAWGWLNRHGQTDSLPLFDINLEPKSLFVAVEDNNAIKERFLQAWPNPTKDRVVLTYPKEAEGLGMVQIFNLDGQLMREFAASDAGFQEIYVTGWPAGIYIAKLIVNNKDFDTVKISVVK